MPEKLTQPEPMTPEEITRCKEAMRKPAPMQALQLIASGRVVIEVARGGRDVRIDELDGRPIRDPEHPDRKMGLAGAWALYGAGMIDQYGVITPAGRAALDGHEGGGR